MKAYIKAAVVVSPQRSFSDHGFPDEIMAYEQVSFLKCIEPVYRDYLDPMTSRRMSRIVKMGVCSALKCLKDSAVDMPDAIIAGTGLGCLEDTERFLGSIFSNEEKLLNPTPFIQSTHNTVTGAIALSLKCQGYNATYTHRGFSFENALQDALLQLLENPGMNILAGGFDELTPASYTITSRLGLWKNHPVNNLELLNYKTRGSLPGEGAAFFTLGGEKGRNDMAALCSVQIFYKPAGFKDVAIAIGKFLGNAGMKAGDIGLVLAGFNGDPASDAIYRHLMEADFSGLPVAAYKHLCGEYDTSTSFAMWLGTLILRTQQVPECIMVSDRRSGTINHVLIYNHLRGNNHSLLLLERC